MFPPKTVRVVINCMVCIGQLHVIGIDLCRFHPDDAQPKASYLFGLGVIHDMLAGCPYVQNKPKYQILMSIGLSLKKILFIYKFLKKWMAPHNFIKKTLTYDGGKPW